jgi:hypothetical protein
MGAFEYRQAEEIRDVFARHGVRYLFIGKSGAIILGYPDTTQDADIERGKDFVQLKNGPFDLDLIFAPDGIERFADAWQRRVVVEGFPVCHLDDIIASKVAANRAKDRESLDRLRGFRDYWLQKRRG